MTRGIRKRFNLQALEISRKLEVDLQIDTLFGFNPVQAFGRINSFPFWFFARGEHWNLRISREVDGDPTLVAGPKTGARYQEQFGDEPHAAGRMTDDEVFAAIEKTVKHFKKHGFPVES